MKTFVQILTNGWDKFVHICPQTYFFLLEVLVDTYPSQGQLWACLGLTISFKSASRLKDTTKIIFV